MSRIKLNLDGVNGSLFIEHGKVIEVGTGSDYQYNTLADAYNAASAGDTILIHPGTYLSTYLGSTKPVHWLGVDKHSCIIYNPNGDKAQSCFNLCGGSTVRNLTIKFTCESPISTEGSTAYRGYCIHADHESMEDNTITIEDCILLNKYFSCIGVGLYQDSTVIIKDCYCEEQDDNPIESIREHGAIYAHGYSGENVTGQFISIQNCYAKSHSNYSLRVDVTSRTGSVQKTEFINNTCISGDLGTADNSIKTTLSAMLDTCHGNNVACLNKNGISDASEEGY